jgi:putative phosphoesterase
MMNSFLLGIISDTHGLLRPEATAALRGSDLIIHAGDVGNPQILDQLRSIAPVFAVRGNVDRGRWAAKLPLRETVDVGGSLIYVLHDLHDIDLDPKFSRIAAVISGHTHRAHEYHQDGALYLNPGSAGPKRFDYPVTLARLHVAVAPWTVELVQL